jgi:hypothetical protein
VHLMAVVIRCGSKMHGHMNLTNVYAVLCFSVFSQIGTQMAPEPINC